VEVHPGRCRYRLDISPQAAKGVADVADNRSLSGRGWARVAIVPRRHDPRGPSGSNRALEVAVNGCLRCGPAGHSAVGLHELGHGGIADHPLQGSELADAHGTAGAGSPQDRDRWGRAGQTGVLRMSRCLVVSHRRQLGAIRYPDYTPRFLGGNRHVVRLLRAVWWDQGKGQAVKEGKRGQE
jgi:hypothetical protein